jgi:hypothetical protein
MGRLLSLLRRPKFGLDKVRLFFNHGYLFVDMDNEGINHTRLSKLFAMLFLSWFARQPGQVFEYLGSCVIEKPEQQGLSPRFPIQLTALCQSYTGGQDQCKT